MSDEPRNRTQEGWSLRINRGSRRTPMASRLKHNVCEVAIILSAAGLMPISSLLAQTSTQIVTPSGLPVQVVPKYPEPGINCSFPQGGLADTGAVTGATDDTGTGNETLGTYSGTGSGVSDATVANNYSTLLGQSVGSGQCVALVQATSDVGLTSTWVPGEQVQGNTNLAAGTVIATFGSDDTYTNTPGQSHAAIYLGQIAQGIVVEDQWVTSAAQVRTIAWTTSNSYESGSQFYVVSH